jgi:DUF971 family protein
VTQTLRALAPAAACDAQRLAQSLAMGAKRSEAALEEGFPPGNAVACASLNLMSGTAKAFCT